LASLTTHINKGRKERVISIIIIVLSFLSLSYREQDVRVHEETLEKYMMKKRDALIDLAQITLVRC